MTHRRRKQTGITALCAVFIMVITACGGSTVTADETATPDADTTSTTVVSVPDSVTSAPETADTPSPTEPTPTEPTPTTDAADDGRGRDDGSCIEGDWTVSEEELSGYYAELGEVSGVQMSASGTARIRFIDSQYVYDAAFDIEMDLEGMPTTAHSDGVATGSYIFEDGIISTEHGASSVSVVVNVGGFEIDASDLGNDLLSSIPINDAPYSCDGPTIFFDSGGPEPHPIKLIPYQG